MSKNKNKKKNANNSKSINFKSKQLKPKKSIVKKNSKNVNVNKKSVVHDKALVHKKSIDNKKLMIKKDGENKSNSENNKNTKVHSDDTLKQIQFKIPKPDFVKETKEDSDLDDIDLSDSEDISDNDEIEDSDGLENVVDSNESDSGSSEDKGNNEINLVSKEVKRKALMTMGSKKIENLNKVNKDSKKDLVDSGLKKPESTKDVKKAEFSKEVTKVKKEVKGPNVIIPEVKPVDAGAIVKKAESSATVYNLSTQRRRILNLINKRREIVAACIIYVKSILKTAKSEEITKNLNNVVGIDLPPQGGKKHRGFGFIRFPTADDASKAIDIINQTKLGDKLMIASKYFFKNVVDDINQVDFSKIILTSFRLKDITESIRARYSTGVTVKKINNVTYELTFQNEADALNLFDKGTINIDGEKLSANFYCSIKVARNNLVIPKAAGSDEVTAAHNSGVQVVPTVSDKVAVLPEKFTPNSGTEAQPTCSVKVSGLPKRTKPNSGKEVVAKKAKMALSQEVKNPKNVVAQIVVDHSEKKTKKKKKKKRSKDAPSSDK